MSKLKLNQAGNKPRKAQPVGPSTDRCAVPGPTDSRDRLRLQKGDGEEIAERVTKDLGLKAEARKGSVYVWDPDNQHLATFSWRTGKGWCLLVRQPTISTRHDLGTGLEEIQRCQAGNSAADEAFEKFKKVKTNKNWAAYQGALAAHFFRLYGGTE